MELYRVKKKYLWGFSIQHEFMKQPTLSLKGCPVRQPIFPLHCSCIIFQKNQHKRRMRPTKKMRKKRYDALKVWQPNESKKIKNL
jgi:hypothetical protein